MFKKPTIGLMMVVRNEEKRLRDCIDWHLPFVDEVAVCDQHSNDGTWLILKDYAMHSKKKFRIWQDKQWGYCEPSKQKTSDMLHTDWVLYLDPDEKFPQEFLKIMHKIVTERDFDGFAFPRNNIFQVQVFDENVPIEPKWLSVQHPAKDYQLRLTKRLLSNFPTFLHHRVRISKPEPKVGKIGYAIEHIKTIKEQWEDQGRYKEVNANGHK